MPSLSFVSFQLAWLNANKMIREKKRRNDILMKAVFTRLNAILCKVILIAEADKDINLAV